MNPNCITGYDFESSSTEERLYLESGERHIILKIKKSAKRLKQHDEKENSSPPNKIIKIASSLENSKPIKLDIEKPEEIYLQIIENNFGPDDMEETELITSRVSEKIIQQWLEDLEMSEDSTDENKDDKKTDILEELIRQCWEDLKMSEDEETNIENEGSSNNSEDDANNNNYLERNQNIDIMRNDPPKEEEEHDEILVVNLNKNKLFSLEDSKIYFFSTDDEEIILEYDQDNQKQIEEYTSNISEEMKISGEESVKEFVLNNFNNEEDIALFFQEKDDENKSLDELINDLKSVIGQNYINDVENNLKDADYLVSYEKFYYEITQNLPEQEKIKIGDHIYNLNLENAHTLVLGSASILTKKIWTSTPEKKPKRRRLRNINKKRSKTAKKRSKKVLSKRKRENTESVDNKLIKKRKIDEKTSSYNLRKRLKN